MEITGNSIFTIEDNKVVSAVDPHVGFDAGTAKSQIIIFADNKYTAQDFFDIQKETKVTTFGAGLTIRYGNFTKRIFTQQILTYGGWANSIKASDVITDIRENENNKKEIILEINLHQNYPNPFNPTTTINYSVPKASNVKIEIYNSLGQLVNVLKDSFHEAGKYNLVWNGKNSSGNSVSSGIYFYRMSAEGFTLVKKMILMK